MFRHIFLLIGTIILLQTNISFAKIIETSDSSVIREKMLTLTEDDLLTFDVKGVIYTPRDQILSPTYVTKFKEEIRKIAREHGNAEARRLEVIVLINYEPMLVDFAIPEIIKEAITRKIKVLALTSGKTGLVGNVKSRENLRLKRLKKLGIDFSSSFEVESMLLDSQYKKGVSLPYSLYKDGVIFTSRRPKGEILEKFLEKVDFKPGKIIHVDNRLKKIMQVENFCQKNSIEFLGIHFTKVYADADKKLDKAVVNKKLEILQEQDRWISDKIAQCMVNMNLDVDQCS